MRRYVKNNTIKTIDEVRAENPKISIPTDANLVSLGYEYLIETEAPTQIGFIAVEDGVVDNALQWKLVEEPVPHTITKLQAMKYMKDTIVDGVSLWTSFNELLATDADANDEWVLCTSLDRDYPLIETLGGAMGLTDVELDNLFRSASKL